MLQQSLCPDHPVGEAWYEVLARSGSPDGEQGPLEECVGLEVTVVHATEDYEEAADTARNHSVGFAQEVWVVDRNDENRVVLAVTPSEYSASGLLRKTGTALGQRAI